ncbi:hydrogenase formation protein HypD [Sulfurospirillum halorespirans]|uniref:NiFe hydrogenase metallocenter assembly protein HypD n=1 Tax=Sulfurospirillum halorespirans DSM 13726 TaxID=1193502 RepID=A0A1D7TJJ2_9BACT|nr:hydrogenase formation protein HypD [Sulfurospirillum halorespirans]AOO65188.1 NiFe hydrogenase metallocenter assembly protein HypD [Sulfurospirillum halorespirans DSM 13726]
MSEVDLIEGFRDPEHMKALAALIKKECRSKINIMEVCGGHTHTIMKFGLSQILPELIEFVHGPGCPVCIMPKERIDHAIALASMPNTILATLGDMIRVPGSKTSLQKLRAEGKDIRSLYSPLDVIKIAQENPDKNVVFFAIGFETTTPMSAVLMQHAIENKLTNVFFHINHVTVPEAVEAIMSSGDALIDAFLGPSHVSVITGYKIYEPIAEKYHTPIVVAGFEPTDVMESVLRIVRQVNEGQSVVDNEYARAVSREGNLKAQELVNTYFEKRSHFRWRGIGDIPNSALKLKAEYAAYDAEIVFDDVLPKTELNDHKMCICGDILKGRAKPFDCKVFGKACTPTNPMGSCMVSSEGACSAYFKYGKLNLKGARA